MATQSELPPITEAEQEKAPPTSALGSRASSSVTAPWIRAQSINVTRHAAALRPFRPEEFGTGAEAPTAGHIQAVNHLLGGLRRGLLQWKAKKVEGQFKARVYQLTPRRTGNRKSGVHVSRRRHRLRKVASR